MEKIANKRKDKRIDCGVPVEGKVGSVFAETKTVDISRGGIGMVSNKKIALNKTIPVEIAVSDNESVLVLGKVLYSRAIRGTSHYRVGLTFTEFLQGSKSILKQAIHS